MEKDAGAIVERVVRRSGIGIAELARVLHVDRRSIYYWFKQRSLKVEILYKIGDALGYDFSVDFPHLIESTGKSSKTHVVADVEAVEMWKRKYIRLLEKYNELLLKISMERHPD